MCLDSNKGTEAEIWIVAEHRGLLLIIDDTRFKPTLKCSCFRVLRYKRQEGQIELQLLRSMLRSIASSRASVCYKLEKRQQAEEYQR